jgi:hypothetical protein
MCRFCAPKSDGYSVTGAEDRVLQLLELLEHPTALPGDLALGWKAHLCDNVR